MKLLKLRIDNTSGFRSLQQGFEIVFHDELDESSLSSFRPFCFAGLNGKGKSNVLEALGNILFHLEVCVARYLPDSIRDPKNFSRDFCTPDAFLLEYLIGPPNEPMKGIEDFSKVVIEKREYEEPGIQVFKYPFDETCLVLPNPRDRRKDKKLGRLINSGKKLEIPDKVFLPDCVVGYSSGENEILSLPFIKSRLIRLDEYRQSAESNARDYDQDKEEKRARNSLIYIDSNMSQAVLLACLIFENDETLKPLRALDNTGILGLKSFRINLHLHRFTSTDENQNNSSEIPILKLLEGHQLQALKDCATSWYIDCESTTLLLDYHVNQATKDAFRGKFGTAFECFQLFRLLYELNGHFIDDRTKEDVYRSKGVYTDGKLPVGSPQQDVFHFLDFYITKELKKTGENKNLLLRSFSDGEHQFLHTIGICLLLNNKRSLLLLDEPETHFNPNWRAKFINVLNDVLSSTAEVNRSALGNVHLLKDILLTSHSPFIISDCQPDHVILFDKDKHDLTVARTARELGIDTYGTSVNILTARIFKSTSTIGDYVLSKLAEHNQLGNNVSLDKIVDKLNNSFGDSIEKLILIDNIKSRKEQNAS